MGVGLRVTLVHREPGFKKKQFCDLGSTQESTRSKTRFSDVLWIETLSVWRPREPAPTPSEPSTPFRHDV